MLAVDRAIAIPEVASVIEARPASLRPLDGLSRVHHPDVLERLRLLDATGGGRIDADTSMSAGSLEAAMLAASAGVDAVESMEAGGYDAAFLAVRPPGHHATPLRSMGFCLMNNAAVAADALRARGHRVAIVDYDAHHGNGTQDVFYADPDVLYLSLHQSPLYPGTGALGEMGTGDGLGATVNVPMPPGATGDVYRAALDEVVLPTLERFRPDWLLLSAGFDAHRNDPLTDLELTAGDFAAMTAILRATVPSGRTIAFLEGGYDLEALERSVAAAVVALAGEEYVPEPPSAGGPGREAVRAAAERFR
jgi:acetoin utilization deacetylase AcuC-like enzyme